MQISKHFKLSEFTKSQVATRNGIKNMPGSGDIKNLGNVAYEILEPVRAKFEKPVMINSGFRCLEFYKPDEDNAGWIHASYCDGNNRKQVLTFDGKTYSDGLPDMEWEKGKVKT